MMTNAEIRAEAWKRLWNDRWLVRLAVAGILLTGILWTVLAGLAVAYRVLEISTLQDFAVAWQKAAAQGLGYTASSGEAMMRMIAASLFQGFMQYLLSGLVMFGAVTLVLRAIRGERERWLAAAFSGFAAPFTMFWLMFGVQMRLVFWIFLATVPAGVLMIVPYVGGMVAVALVVGVLCWCIYRYRNVWFLRVDHPEWSAGQCIAGSVETMKGWKMRAFGLDCSFLGALSGVFALLLVAFVLLQRVLSVGLSGFTALHYALFAALGLPALVYLLVVGWYVTLAHAVFYRELTGGKQTL